MNDIDFLIQKILEDNPRAEVRPGSAQRDLLIVPHSKLLEPVEEERSTIARAQYTVVNTLKKVRGGAQSSGGKKAKPHQRRQPR